MLGAGASLLLFAGAVFVLHSELRDHPVHEIMAELRTFPALRLALSLAATVLGFLALAGYDAISLAALGRRLPFRRVAIAAFLGYAFANSLPLSVVTGAAVRYRLYSQWGIERGDAARVITLNTVTYVVGLLASAGLAFALQPVLVPGFLRLPLHTARPLGFVCLAVVAGYLIWSGREGDDLRIWRWELPRPTFRRARRPDRRVVRRLGVLRRGAVRAAAAPGAVSRVLRGVPAGSDRGAHGAGAGRARRVRGGHALGTHAGALDAVRCWSDWWRTGWSTFSCPSSLATGFWVAREGSRWLRRRRAGAVRRASA